MSNFLYHLKYRIREIAASAEDDILISVNKLALVIMLIAATTLLIMGRAPICDCGVVKLWYFELNTSEGSQHLIDWYTPSHLLHGILFYAILWLIARRTDMGWRIVVATIVEATWEIVENTNMIIERYREATISLDYYGDSVINSVADMLAMAAGFWLARRLPVWVSVAIVIGFEMLTTLLIRDGLILNIAMLTMPMEVVRDWQSGL